MRLNGASRENIEEFFGRLREPRIASIPPQFTYNFDEVGAQIALGKNTLVIGPASLNEVLTMDTGLREWVTSMECCSAAGRVLPPLVIFKGLSVQQQWFVFLPDGDFDDWCFEASPAGWTSNSIALRWLKQVFLPLTQPEDPNQWRHLILDGHATHCTEDFMLACFEAKV